MVNLAILRQEKYAQKYYYTSLRGALIKTGMSKKNWEIYHKT